MTVFGGILLGGTMACAGFCVGVVTAPHVTPLVSASSQTCNEYLQASFLQDPAGTRHAMQAIQPIIDAGNDQGMVVAMLQEWCRRNPGATIDAVVASLARMGKQPASR